MQAICSQCRKLLVCYANLSLSIRFTVCSYLWVRVTNDLHLPFTLIAAMSLVGCWRGLLGAGLVPTGGPPGTNLAKRYKKQVINIDICNWLQLSKHCHHCSIIKHNYCYLICILYLHIHMYMYNLRLCFFALWLSFLTLFTTEHSFGSLSFLQVQEILKNHHHHHLSPASHSQLAHSFVFFWKHLTLVDISLQSITLSAIAHSRAVSMMSSSEKCLLGLIHFWTWLQKGLLWSPC